MVHPIKLSFRKKRRNLDEPHRPGIASSLRALQ
jgi:hypothetical protein